MLTISKQPSTIVTQMQNTEKYEKWKEEEKKMFTDMEYYIFLVMQILKQVYVIK